MPERSFHIHEAEAGARLDVFLARVLPASRGQVRALLSAGGVAVDGSAVGLGAKGRILTVGQSVGLSEPTLAAASAPS